MPKYFVNLKAGNPLPSEVKGFLLRYCDIREIERLERFGGRVAISIAAPYVERHKRDRRLVIDGSFVQRLRSETTDTERLQELLAALTVLQLKALCRLLGEPVRSSANRGEIASGLIRNLQAEGFWQRISSTRQKVIDKTP